MVNRVDYVDVFFVVEDTGFKEFWMVKMLFSYMDFLLFWVGKVKIKEFGWFHDLSN